MRYFAKVFMDTYIFYLGPNFIAERLHASIESLLFSCVEILKNFSAPV